MHYCYHFLKCIKHKLLYLTCFFEFTGDDFSFKSYAIFASDQRRDAIQSLFCDSNRSECVFAEHVAAYRVIQTHQGHVGGRVPISI